MSRLAVLALASVPLLLPTGGQLAGPGAGPQASAETIAGVLVVDGGPPREPIEVRLTTTAGRIETEPRTTTDASGAFRFDGASTDWKGELRFPPLYVIEAGGDRVVLERPAVDLVVRLVSAPAIVGRVLDPGLSSVADAQGTVEQTCVGIGSTGRSSTGFGTRRGGLFRGTIQPCAGTSSFLLEVWKPGVGYAAIELDDVDPAVGRDVGDVVLQPETELLVHVVAEGGEPIEGARVLTDLPGRAISGPTTPAGFLALSHLRRGVSELTVAAPGRVAARVRLPERRPPGVEVVLARGTSLVVHAIDGAGLRAPDVVVQLSAGEPPLDLPSGAWPDWLPGSAGGRTVEKSDGEREVTQGFFSDARGDVALADLRAGLELAVTVEDRNGLPVERSRTVVTGPEPVELTFVVPPARRVSGRVVDDRGLPVAGARIGLGGRGAGWLTDAGGRFTIPGVRANAIDLEVRREGFATRWLTELVPAASDGLEIVLEPGHAIDVEVVDGQGAPVEARIVRALHEGRAVGRPQRGDDGRWRLTELPTGLLTIEAWVDDEVHRVQREADVGAVVIRLPR